MNVALFINELNYSGIEAFVQNLAKLQKSKINGALVAVHQDTISNNIVAQLIEPIRHLFPEKGVGVIPVSVNSTMKNEGRVSTMFSTFIMKGYAKFPGPWLVVDDYAIPKGEDFINLLEKQHNQYNAPMSGRGIIEPGSLIPLGPVVMNMPAKDLKSFLSQTGESWRSRGRFQFARSKFAIIPKDEYLFNLSDKDEVSNSKEPVTKKTVNKEAPKFDPSVLENVPQVKGIATVGGVTQDAANAAANAAALTNPNIANGRVTPVVESEKEKEEGVESTQVLVGPGVTQEDDIGLGKVIQEDAKAFNNLDDISHGDVPPDASPLDGKDYSSLSRNELYNLFWSRTGEKPHPKIGEATLIKRLEEIDGNAQ